MWDEKPEGDRVREYFASGAGEIRYIFAPFIQKDTLENVIPMRDTDTVIVTRWRLADLMSGVSDPEVFEWVREHEYTLKIHPKLHAKVYSWDLDTALIGSSNLTNSGMGLGNQPNVEVLHGPTPLPVEIQFKLRQTEKEAQLVTKDDYMKTVEYLENTTTEIPNYGNIDIGEDPEFLVSQLPMTEEPDVLISVLAGDHSRVLDDLELKERQCVLHDVATYSLDGLSGKSEATVREGVRQRFLNHNFINMIVERMDPCIHFGKMKVVVQENCADVPTPSRRELTGNIQVLYNWFPKVAPDRFKHNIPGSHSERLCDTNKSTF
jgi:hypothetical protein